MVREASDAFPPGTSASSLLGLAATGPIRHGIDCADLHKLTLLSTLMTERDENDILELASAAVPELVPCTNSAFLLDGRGWWPATPNLAPDLLAELHRPNASPRLLSTGGGYTYAVPIRSLTRHAGYVVVQSASALGEGRVFPLQILGQQLAVAIDNARRHARELRTAAELDATNVLLERTVGELRELLHMQEALSHVAAQGRGVEGIVATVLELTGRPTMVEDEGGTVRARAGDWQTDQCQRSPEVRARLLERLRHEARPIRHRGQLVALAGHRPGSDALLVLSDPDQKTSEYERHVLEYAATVLAMDMARSASVAEAELRLRRDLIEELLLGLAESAAEARAAALGIDLGRPRRVVIVEPLSPPHPGALADRLLHLLRRVLHGMGDAGLLVTRGAGVVCLADADIVWSEVLRDIATEPGGGSCRVGVGSVSAQAAEFPVSLRHARQALRFALRSASAGVVTFDDLGVFRLFALNADTADLDQFVDTWLRPLIDYDAARSAELIHTLTSYLRTGGSLAATAADLVIHRSTVKYRLERVRSLTGYDLTDPGTLFSLQLATYALETRRTLLGPSGERETP
jgi:sugar diacid utilization regulator